MNPHDEQVQQAVKQALREIARWHEYALHAVWHHYPTPQRRHRTHPDSGTPPGQASPDPPP